MLAALRHHWPQYLCEALCLGLFLVAALLGCALLEHPASPLLRALPHPDLRRALLGVLMGLTATGLIHAPFGRRSGAHMNPATTLTFLRLGRIAPADAAWYCVFQTLGGLLGVVLTATVAGDLVRHPAVALVVTVPGPRGRAAACAGEFAIAFATMLTVLTVGDHPRLGRFAGRIVGGLVACWVTFEAPLSGFGMNPARTLASAVPAQVWTGLWIYLLVPPLGMLAAAQVHLWRAGTARVSGARVRRAALPAAARALPTSSLTSNP